MVLALLFTYITSGRLVARWGRYKIFPVAGTGIMALALVLLSTMDTSTPIEVAWLFMAILGFGMGMVVQILVLVVQNAVPHEQLGTATSGATFFRSVGGAFGVALFGSILIWSLTSDLHRFLTAAQIKQVSIKALTTSPAVIDKLPPSVHAGVVHAYSAALGTVFLVAAPFGIAAFILSMFLKEVPLRDREMSLEGASTADIF
jgi:MFS family permease